MTFTDLLVLILAAAGAHRVWIVEAIAHPLRWVLSHSKATRWLLCVPCSAFWITVACLAASRHPWGELALQALAVWFVVVTLWPLATLRAVKAAPGPCRTCKGSKP